MQYRDRRVMLLTAYEFGNPRAAGGVIIVPASVAVRFPAIFARLVAASDGGVKRKLYADRFWASTRSSESAFVGAYGGAAAAPPTAPTYAGTLPPPPPPLSRLLQQQQQQPRSLIQSMEIESGFEAADLVGESDEEIEQDFLFLFDAAPSDDDSEANEGHLKAIANDAKKAKKDTALRAMRANLARLRIETDEWSPLNSPPRRLRMDRSSSPEVRGDRPHTAMPGDHSPKGSLRMRPGRQEGAGRPLSAVPSDKGRRMRPTLTEGKGRPRSRGDAEAERGDEDEKQRSESSSRSRSPTRGPSTLDQYWSESPKSRRRTSGIGAL